MINIHCNYEMSFVSFQQLFDQEDNKDSTAKEDDYNILSGQYCLDSQHLISVIIAA